MPKTNFVGIHVELWPHINKVLIILDNFEIIFIGALFGPGTAVTTESKLVARRLIDWRD